MACGPGAFWDDAINGSSALQAALSRRLLDELEADSPGVTITGYCDIEEFYDSLNIATLIHHALDCEFPRVPLTLLLQVHLSTRLLRVNKWNSKPLLPAHPSLLDAAPAGTLQGSLCTRFCKDSTKHTGPAPYTPGAL